MLSESRKDKLLSLFERVTVSVLQVIIMLSVAVATIILCILFVDNLYLRTHEIESVGGLLPAMQRVFAGVLVVLLGLELAETMKSYFAEHHVRVEVILVVAIVAVSRHMIQLDFDHVAGSEVIALSALILSLTVGYFLVKKAQANMPAPISDSATMESEQAPQPKRTWREPMPSLQKPLSQFLYAQRGLGPRDPFRSDRRRQLQNWLLLCLAHHFSPYIH
jgi:uncharacterized membrane protein (DUF373 family)